ncbi:hypothetical protein GCM10025869_20180 [Homoserinibacter gongjuensis]|uniref:Apea-like HEPN domain-containing protein n=1 Tax=Homoserinibacter gongjuensis TaxID=1162968 RepID=A0ABQ6JWM0_9MICO|nr:hypothetical protein GCM10025869_20180 [Homoserinibacter gongjuensis]
MDFELLYRFFTESHDALVDGPGELDLAVANTVVWACAVDEALEASGGENYKLARSADAHGAVLVGLRLARNAILHGQSFAVRYQGLEYPLKYPLFYGPLVWRSYGDLIANAGLRKPGRPASQSSWIASSASTRRVCAPRSQPSRLLASQKACRRDPMCTSRTVPMRRPVRSVTGSGAPILRIYVRLPRLPTSVRRSWSGELAPGSTFAA